MRVKADIKHMLEVWGGGARERLRERGNYVVLKKTLTYTYTAHTHTTHTLHISKFEQMLNDESHKLLKHKG